jgi:hypothetical protein
MTARDADEGLIVRPRAGHDGALPSGASLMAEVLARLAGLTDDARWREAAERLLRAGSGSREALVQSPLLLAAADVLERGPVVVVEGPLNEAGADALGRTALAAPDPAITVLRVDPALWPGGAPGGRGFLGDAPAAMACRGQTCSLPVKTPDALRDLLAMT